MSLIAARLAALGEDVHYLTGARAGMRWGRRDETQAGVRVSFVAPFYVPRAPWRATTVRLARMQQRRALRRLIERFNIELVYTYSDHETLDALHVRDQLVGRFKVVKRVAGFRWETELADGTLSRSELETVMRGIDGINYLSDSVRELMTRKLKEYGIGAPTCAEFVGDIGVDVEQYVAAEGLPMLPTGRSTLVCAARLTQTKRQDLVLRALAAIGDPFLLHIMGDGVRRNELEGMAKELGIAESVVFHGFCTPDRMREIMRSADLSVLPTEVEGMPKSMLEAMAMRIPVVASNIVPLNHYISDGANGFLVENSVEAWNDVLTRALHLSVEVQQQVVARAYEYVSEHGDSRRCVRRYQSAFHALLNGTDRLAGPSV